MRKKNKRFFPIYFNKVCLIYQVVIDAVFLFSMHLKIVVKCNLVSFVCLVIVQEDIEKELSKVSRASRGTGLSQHIMVSYIYIGIQMYIHAWMSDCM